MADPKQSKKKKKSKEKSVPGTIQWRNQDFHDINVKHDNYQTANMLTNIVSIKYILETVNNFTSIIRILSQFYIE